jgi:hypothetical protein
MKLNLYDKVNELAKGIENITIIIKSLIYYKSLYNNIVKLD